MVFGVFFRFVFSSEWVWMPCFDSEWYLCLVECTFTPLFFPPHWNVSNADAIANFPIPRREPENFPPATDFDRASDARA